MYDTITNHNDWNRTSLYNVKIRKLINQVMLEEQAEANNATVNTLIPQRKESEDMINNFMNLKVNEVGNYLINKWTNLTINVVKKNLINKATKLTINDV